MNPTKTRAEILRQLAYMVDLSQDDSQIVSTKARKALIGFFAELLKPYPPPPTLLEDILQQAAQRAGWHLPSDKAHQRQIDAARARTKQREEDLAIRRVLVSYLFKQLPLRLRKKPGSTGTAQAIIGGLDKLPFQRRPPIIVRTIQEDIRYMRKDGRFGF
jgi:hypothetical protein